MDVPSTCYSLLFVLLLLLFTNSHNIFSSFPSNFVLFFHFRFAIVYSVLSYSVQFICIAPSMLNIFQIFLVFSNAMIVFFFIAVVEYHVSYEYNRWRMKFANKLLTIRLWIFFSLGHDELIPIYALISINFNNSYELASYIYQILLRCPLDNFRMKSLASQQVG